MKRITGFFTVVESLEGIKANEPAYSHESERKGGITRKASNELVDVLGRSNSYRFFKRRQRDWLKMAEGE